MSNSSIIWYTKNRILRLFDMSERTYFRKLELIKVTDNISIKIVKNKRGRDTKSIYIDDLIKVFSNNKCPKNINNDESFKSHFIITTKWDYIGNIIPENTKVTELSSKMKYLLQILKKYDKDSVLHYSIEPNTKDQYFHSHFLIKSNINKKELYDILTLVCEENNLRERRIYLEEYDYKSFNNRGSSYSSKQVNFKNFTRSVISEVLI
jgi:hypothetical protein